VILVAQQKELISIFFKPLMKLNILKIHLKADLNFKMLIIKIINRPVAIMGTNLAVYFYCSSEKGNIISNINII